MVSDQSKIVATSCSLETSVSSNLPVPLIILPTWSTSHNRGGDQFVTTILSSKPNLKPDLTSGPVSALIEVPTPLRISEVTQTRVCNIQSPWLSQSAIAAQTLSIGALILMRIFIWLADNLITPIKYHWLLMLEWLVQRWCTKLLIHVDLVLQSLRLRDDQAE